MQRLNYLYCLTIFTLLFSSCSYQVIHVITEPDEYRERLSTSIEEDRSIYLLEEDSLFTLSDVKLDRNTLEAITTPSELKWNNVQKVLQRKSRRLKYDEMPFMYSVFIHVNENQNGTRSPTTIPYDDIEKVDFVDPDNKKSAWSMAAGMGGAGVVIGIVLMLNSLGNMDLGW